ncbi:hypothetical protein BD309DRAFT_45209 [Dichomitus squalens]|uniref:Uncharacterized protein n=1 Tax=Dichomitus squalens TaxID=114155 RepID=A0A4Q9PXB6_9APHY|nr:hypothetical protein BD309DRAFT_45209 [Dichomitus squalens]TBU59199.1 hypothetical protein BD310DRAFT_424578 [Dichomitus squalens]
MRRLPPPPRFAHESESPSPSSTDKLHHTQDSHSYTLDSYPDTLGSAFPLLGLARAHQFGRISIYPTDAFPHTSNSHPYTLESYRSMPSLCFRLCLDPLNTYTPDPDWRPPPKYRIFRGLLPMEVIVVLLESRTRDVRSAP